MLFNLLSGVANNLNGESGELKGIKVFLKAIRSRAIRSGGEAQTAAVDSRRANDGRKRGNGLFKGIKVFLEKVAINGRAIRSGGEAQTAAVNSGGANDGRKGSN